MILNRRALLGAIGLSLPALASAEADSHKKKPHKPALHRVKAPTHRPHHTKPTPIQS